MDPDWRITDIHAHVLAGLDDGPKAVSESLRMCELYDAENVRTVVATPHMCDPRFNVRREAVVLAADSLSEACRRRGLDVRVLPGGDVRLQPELLDCLDSGRALTIANNGRYFLLELPLHAVPPLDDLIFRLSVRKLTPILTHPERNAELSRKPGRLVELVERGCLVQVTGASFLGRFGRSAKKAAERFLKSGVVHVVASDAHSPDGGRCPLFKAVADRLVRLAGDDKAYELLCGAPAGIVNGDPVDASAARSGSAGQRATSASIDGHLRTT